MTEADRLASDDPYRMMQFLLRRKGDRRKLRLLACFSCRQLWHAMTDERSKRAVEIAERFVDEEASWEEVLRAQEKASEAHSTIFQRYFDDRNTFFADAWRRGRLGADEQIAAQSARFLLSHLPSEFAVVNLQTEYIQGDREVPQYVLADRRRVAQVNVLRCIFSNVFRHVALSASWTTSTVVALAHTAYDERILPSGLLDRDRLAVLSDPLEDEGCDDTTLLDHLSGPGPHARGCWALDILLGKRGRRR